MILAQLRDGHLQVKDNEIVDSGSLQGDRVRYNTGDSFMQVNFTVTIWGDFWEVVQ